MTTKYSWFEQHYGLTLIIECIIILLAIASVTIFVLMPEKDKEVNELKSMDCNSIKKHLADQDFGYMLDESRYNAQYIWRCTK